MEIEREKVNLKSIEWSTQRNCLLRRQISFKKPYDKVILENDVKRLKKEVKDQ